MQRYTSILFLVLSLHWGQLVAQDPFAKALDQLKKDLAYIPQEVRPGVIFTIYNGVPPYLHQRVEHCSSFFIKPIQMDFSPVKQVRAVSIKSKKPIEKALYLRLQIEEWTMASPDSALKYCNRMNEFFAPYIDCVNKGGMYWWVVQERIYVLYSQAKRFSFEFDAIEKSMNKKLIGE